MRPNKAFIAISVLVSSLTTNVQTDDAFPTHCKSDEHRFLDARMAPMEFDKDGYFLNKKNGKVLSLCTDEAKEPFGKLIYRYGAIGKVEMEKTATEAQKFYIDSQVTSPHTGEDIIFFNVGQFEYHVEIATGQGHGIELAVYRGSPNQRILSLFSGLDIGSDYLLGSAYLDTYFPEASSPIFLRKASSRWY